MRKSLIPFNYPVRTFKIHPSKWQQQKSNFSMNLTYRNHSELHNVTSIEIPMTFFINMEKFKILMESQNSWGNHMQKEQNWDQHSVLIILQGHSN